MANARFWLFKRSECALALEDDELVVGLPADLHAEHDLYDGAASQ